MIILQFQLLTWCQKVLPKKWFHLLMKSTFYGHFVAGEDQISIRPIISQNRKFGVKSILDYSAEEDVSSEKAVESEIKLVQLFCDHNLHPRYCKTPLFLLLGCCLLLYTFREPDFCRSDNILARGNDISCRPL